MDLTCLLGSGEHLSSGPAACKDPSQMHHDVPNWGQRDGKGSSKRRGNGSTISSETPPLLRPTATTKSEYCAPCRSLLESDCCSHLACAFRDAVWGLNLLGFAHLYPIICSECVRSYLRCVDAPSLKSAIFIPCSDPEPPCRRSTSLPTPFPSRSSYADPALYSCLVVHKPTALLAVPVFR